MYQAISRGNLRNTVSGNAGVMNIYFIHRQDVEVLALLRERMPGVKSEPFDPKFLKPPKRANAIDFEARGKQILEFLNSHSADTVSTKSVTLGIGITVKELRREWDGAKAWITGNQTGWTIDGRNFIKTDN